MKEESNASLTSTRFSSLVSTPTMKRLKTSLEPIQGVPLPSDLELSASSLNSSISAFEVENADQISLIKDYNKEIRRAATMAIKKFKHTSQDLLTVSKLESGSILMTETQEISRRITDIDIMINKNKEEKEEGLKTEAASMEMILKKISEIQREIKEAEEKLGDSEKLIQSTQKNHLMLESDLVRIEESVNSVLVTEGPEKSSYQSCNCKVF